MFFLYWVKTIFALKSYPLKKNYFLQAAPIFCGKTDGGAKETGFQRTAEDEWREKCKNVSGITVDTNRNDRLFLEYENCTKTVVNTMEVQQEMESIFPDFDRSNIEHFNISQEQKLDLVTLSKK